MKKILFFILLITAAAVFSTCDRNDIYYYTDNPGESLLLAAYLNNLTKRGNPGTPPTRIYIYTAGQYDGALGGRTGADALCAAGAPSVTTTHHAFLSVSASDLIRNLLPVAFRSLAIPVTDSSGSYVLSTSWAGLWDGSINTTLTVAGILPNGSQWWSGSNANGTYNSNSCGNWNTNSGRGQIGASIYDNDPQWINAIDQGCSASCYVLCMAY